MRSDQKKGILFLAITLSPYFLYHFALAVHYGKRIGVEALSVLLILLILSTASSFLIAIRRSKVTRAAIRIGLLWIGVSFLLLLATIATILIELVLSTTLPAALPLLAATLLTLYSIGASQTPTLKHLTVHTKQPSKKRVAQLSDVHLGDFYGATFLTKALEKTMTQDPDVIVITGDLVDGTEPPQKEWFAPLAQITQHTPVIFVEGNHELYTDTKKIMHYLTEAGVTILQDTSAEIQGIYFSGRIYRSTKPTKTFNPPTHKTSVLLQHEPVQVNEASAAGFDLMLCGHTHNAQLWPLHVFAKMTYQFVTGTHMIGNMTLHINSGTGTWGPPLRLGSISEVTIIDLH